jgi:hypothetical protein
VEESDEQQFMKLCNARRNQSIKSTQISHRVSEYLGITHKNYQTVFKDDFFIMIIIVIIIVIM